MQDFKPSKQADQNALRMVQGMLAEFILNEIIDQRAASMILQQMPPREFILDAQNFCVL